MVSVTSKQYSWDMYDQTERPGNCFPLRTHQIIAHRYFVAAEYVKDKDVLEIGCGAGLGLPVLKAHSRFLVGGEYSAENIDILRDAGNDICPILRLDAHKLPFADNSFDCVVAMAMVYYLDFEKFVAEVKRVLRPGGTFFFDSSNKDMPGFGASPYIRKYYSVPELSEVLTAAGYDVSFYGSFAEEEGLRVRRIKGLIKDVVKVTVFCLPRGKIVWQKLRSQAQLDVLPLPNHIGDVGCRDIKIEALDGNAVNRTHRVIYVVAEKKL